VGAFNRYLPRNISTCVRTHIEHNPRSPRSRSCIRPYSWFPYSGRVAQHWFPEIHNIRPGLAPQVQNWSRKTASY